MPFPSCIQTRAIENAKRHAVGTTSCVSGRHSNGEGLANDLYYGNHQWKLQDVVFRHRSAGGAINIGDDERPAGNTPSIVARFAR